MTNGDSIRLMSDEELAQYIEVCHGECQINLSCTECRLEWLKQPVEED
jgi:hypothetical protein